MAQQDYIPPKDADFIGWHDHYKEEVANLKTTFGLTDPEVAAVVEEENLLTVPAVVEVAAVQVVF